MIKTEHEFLQTAMQSYDNPACISLEEFQYDLHGYSYIKRALKRYQMNRENLMRLVNHVIIFYNCFGKNSTDLLLFKITEPDLRAILIPILLHLGWTVDQTGVVSIDNRTITELGEIFK